ncbi:uncharacterized protein VP01_27g10 [Puccinia sorghi]|uniref:ATP-dependent DNA helicase sgs1 n=1 Tax=Puccinia sorghi TaxID=27349 RepID=A0A0L6V4D2_9BASI|nr:uncharacterized protein VP01_27g10 [Puccinia sorghi]
MTIHQSKSQRNDPCPYIILDPKITNIQDTELQAFIFQDSNCKFGVEPTDLQVNTVICLVNKKPIFVLAGTGYGKSRIAKMFWSLHDACDKPIVLVLNPLDVLGDNQAKEEEKKNILVVNFTKMSLNHKTEKEIIGSNYSFVLSLEPRSLPKKPNFS